MVELAAGHGAGKTLAKGRLVGIVELRVWSENKHEEFVILDFAPEVEMVSWTRFPVPRYVLSPLSQSVQYIDSPALGISDYWLCVWGVLPVGAV